MDESMEKRILLSFALSLAVLMAFSWLFAPAPSPSSPEVNPEIDNPVPSEIEAPAAGRQIERTPRASIESPTGQIGRSIAETAFGALEGDVLAEELRAERIEQILIDTTRFELRISNEGARLENVQLKDYAGAEGEALELIDQEAGESVGWPLAISTGDTAIDEAIETALFVVDESENSVRMRYRSEGLQVVKEFRFDPDTYGVEVEADVTQDGVALPFFLLLQGNFGDQSRDYQPALTNIVYLDAGEFERINVGGLDEPQAINPTTYVGLEDQFFMAMLRLPDRGVPAVTGVAVNPEAEDVALAPRVGVPYPGEAVTVYVGPKQQDALRQIDPALVEIIDYGFFAILVRPLLLALLWIHGYVGNFGWAIVILTLGINFILFPLRLKQQLSMLKMQKIQPLMRTLQDKFKKLKANDPRRQEVQTEMMALYKKHGVNPMGGCLPIVLQMPFLFAVFSMLRSSIELRGAPWALWINDLSAYDPYYVMPVLMGGSMFAMQLITPMMGDPTQVRIMRLMPLMLIVMFLRQSSGLMLYWLTGNLVGLAQQYFINRRYRTNVGDSKQDRRKEEEGTPQEEPLSEAPAPHEPDEPDTPKRRRRRGHRKA